MIEEGKPKVRPKIVWCDPCNGQGWCMVKDVPFECMCGHLKRVAAGMPPYIKQANVAREHVVLPIVRQPRENLFITASWGDMQAVIKIMMMIGTNGHIKVIDEQELIAAYVGSMGKAAKSADYVGVIYNNISDLVSPPDLAIIRLGTLSNKNKAAAGVLIDAVNTRIDYGKPTWLLCNISDENDMPTFHQHSMSYSDDLIKIVASNFKSVFIPRINKRDADIVRDFMSAISPLSLGPDPVQQEAPRKRAPKIGHDPEAEPERRPRREEKPEDETVGNLGSTYGVGVKPSRTKFRK
jgi:hypothetical protein